MNEVIYPTWALYDWHWVFEMISKWKGSEKPKLCFPWVKFKVHTLPPEPFWMYLYYAVSRTDIPELKGRIEYRVRVRSWRPELKYDNGDILLERGNEDGTAWFLCDRFEEIAKRNGDLLTLTDFHHAYGKNLVSTLRNSIPPVRLQPQVKVLSAYP